MFKRRPSLGLTKLFWHRDQQSVVNDWFRRPINELLRSAPLHFVDHSQESQLLQLVEPIANSPLTGVTGELSMKLLHRHISFVELRQNFHEEIVGENRREALWKRNRWFTRGIR